MTGKGRRFWSNVARSLSLPTALLLAVAVLWPVPAAASSAILNINVSSLPAGTAGQSYKASLAASGGTGSYTWQARGLPAGLGISTSNGTATVSGIPSKPGTFTVTLTVYDSARNWGATSLALTVNPALTVPTVTLPAATVGTPYSTDVSGANGGSGSYTWQAAGLPAGLGCASTNGTATISGTPIKSGTFSVALTLYDSANDKTTINLSLTVNPAVAMRPANLPPAAVGTPYSVTFSASGGTGGYTWWAGGLPPGLSLSSSKGTATITGTPSQYGLFRAIVSVQDSAGDGAGIDQYLVVSYPSSSDSSTPSANPPGDANIGAIGPDGGTVSTPDGSASVDVPQGAFRAQTVLSISQFATPYPALPGFTPASPQWDISTSGEEPVQPVTVSFQYDPTVLGNLDPARLGVYLYNPATGTWKWLAGQAGDNTVTVSTLSLGVFAAQAETQVFQDMDQAPWAQTAVDNLLGAGIVSGTGPGQFAPLQNLTRAQFAVMLARLTGLAPAADGRTPFADVPPSAWYAPYVAAAVNTSLLEGTSPATFSPDTPVTREEMAVVLARLPQTSSTTTDVSQFSDAASIDSWAAGAVGEVVGSNLMSGFPDGTFQPLEPTTRAQAAVVLYNYLSQSNQS